VGCEGKGFTPLPRQGIITPADPVQNPYCTYHPFKINDIPVILARIPVVAFLFLFHDDPYNRSNSLSQRSSDSRVSSGAPKVSSHTSDEVGDVEPEPKQDGDNAFEGNIVEPEPAEVLALPEGDNPLSDPLPPLPAPLGCS